MAVNPNITQLDFPQAVSRCVDPLNDALRTVIESTDLSIALSANEGDSIQTFAGNGSGSITIDLNNTGSNTEIIAPMSVTGYNKIALYVNSITPVASTPTITVQYSPAASGNIWVSSGVSVAMSAVSGTTVIATVDDKMVAMRARAIISAALTGAESGIAYMLVST